MKTFGLIAAFSGMLLAHTAQAGVIQFSDNDHMLVATSGTGSANYSTGAGSDQVIDGAVNLSFADTIFWSDGFYNTTTEELVGSGSRGRTSAQEMVESINSWNFTISHGGVTEAFSPSTATLANTTHFGGNTLNFATNAFDGIVAGGDWVLTATTDYWLEEKRKIQYDLSGSFNVAAANPSPGSTPTSSNDPSSGGGQVPVPGPLALLLPFGLMGGLRLRRNKTRT